MRWEPDSRGRLEHAAMELYSDQGFDKTTVEEIAGRAGLTERTFFRHFADKREVLFGGAGALQEFLVTHVLEAPESLAPIEAIAAALMETGSAIFDERREFARTRQAIVTASVELRERELIKLATLASALALALRRRGVSDPSASLAAEAGVAAFRVAFEAWVEDTTAKPLAQFIRESVDALKTVTTDG
ncbi:MAG TPA: TetR family transcriptional regulator [Acidimicrobiales bacterium]